MTLEDFFTLTEMKDGLTMPTRVEDLINVMHDQKDSIAKTISDMDMTRQWSTVASTIIATEDKDCLNLFIQLDGLCFIDKWLNEAQRLGIENGNNFVEESVMSLLRVLEKLQIDYERSSTSGILATVEKLISHGSSSKVQDEAKALFNRWKEMEATGLTERENDPSTPIPIEQEKEIESSGAKVDEDKELSIIEDDHKDRDEDTHVEKMEVEIKSNSIEATSSSRSSSNGENLTQNSSSSQELKGVTGLDLNQEVCSEDNNEHDDRDHDPIPIHISQVSAIRAAAATLPPELVSSPIQHQIVEGDRQLPDFDLNVADEEEENEADNKPMLDLNVISHNSDSLPDLNLNDSDHPSLKSISIMGTKVEVTAAGVCAGGGGVNFFSATYPFYTPANRIFDLNNDGGSHRESVGFKPFLSMGSQNEPSSSLTLSGFGVGKRKETEGGWEGVHYSNLKRQQPQPPWK